MLVTALAPHIGYDKAAEIAKQRAPRGHDAARSGGRSRPCERSGFRRLGTAGSHDGSPAAGLTASTPADRVLGRPCPAVDRLGDGRADQRSRARELGRVHSEAGCALRDLHGRVESQVRVRERIQGRDVQTCARLRPAQCRGVAARRARVDTTTRNAAASGRGPTTLGLGSAHGETWIRAPRRTASPGSAYGRGGSCLRQSACGNGCTSMVCKVDGASSSLRYRKPE